MFFKRMYERQLRWLGYLTNRKSDSSDCSDVLGKRHRLPRLLGFTLVELIVVITILAILGTIGFVSIQSYSSKSRDSVRISDLATASKGMETYRITAGSYPIPDSVYGTGQIGGVTLSSVGYLGDSAASLIRMDKAPLDPLSKSKYTYGVDIDRKQYQIAVVVENPYAMNGIWWVFYAYSDIPSKILEMGIPTAHAANTLYQARVSGTYVGIVKVGTVLYNPPSLLFSNTGTIDLANTGTRFIYHKGENLPYAVSGSVPGSKTPTEVLSAVGSSASTLTGITITDWKTQSGALVTSLGYPVDTLWVAYYGSTKYYTEVAQGNVPVEVPASTTFSLSASSVTAWWTVTISDTCSVHPTGYTSSNTSVATISGTTITAVSSGTTNIAPTGGNCSDSTAKTLTVTAAAVIRDEQQYISPWTYTWTVPAWVTKVSMVCVGWGGKWGLGWGNAAGAGGGGALAYKNGYTVVPGSVLSVVVWSGGNSGAQDGGSSSIAIPITSVSIDYQHTHSDGVTIYVEYYSGGSWNTAATVITTPSSRNTYAPTFSAVSSSTWRLRFVDPGDSNIGNSDRLYEVVFRSGWASIASSSTSSVFTTASSGNDGDSNTYATWNGATTGTWDANVSSSIMVAGGGFRGYPTGGAGGTRTGWDGGGGGGAGGNYSGYTGGGGGGAGGYSWAGWAGGNWGGAGYQAGSGGSGAGGGAATNSGQNGGWVGIMGQGSSGSSAWQNGSGGGYGYGGGGGADSAANAKDGGGGACRIIWPGDTRQFPWTDVGAS